MYKLFLLNVIRVQEFLKCKFSYNVVTIIMIRLVIFIYQVVNVKFNLLAYIENNVSSWVKQELQEFDYMYHRFESPLRDEFCHLLIITGLIVIIKTLLHVCLAWLLLETVKTTPLSYAKWSESLVRWTLC